MSMLCTIFRVTPNQIAAILDDPNLVADLLDAPEVDLPVQKPEGLFARLFTNSRKSASPEVKPPEPRKLEVIPDSGCYELDKTWHILHYLLTGLTEGGDLPASFIMSGGCEIGRDNGYDSPQLLSSDQTQEIATYLQSLAFDEFSGRYQRDRRIIEAKVYGGAADSEDERMKDVQWLWQTLAELGNFLAETADAGVGIILAAGIALMLSGCATPVSVKHVDIPTAYRLQTASAISSSQPSNASSIVLRQHGLQDRFETEPAVVLAELHKGLEPAGDDDQLFALAELSLLHAQQTNDRAYYLASAVYAWSLLFPGDGKGMQIPPTDPRFRLAYDIYNQAVAQGLAAPGDAEENEVSLKAANYKLPFGTLQVSLDKSGMSWGGYPLDRFISTTALEVDGLRNRYHKSGIGVPLAASLAKTPPSGKKVVGSERLGPHTKVPVTALLRFDNARNSLGKGKIQGRIEVYAADQTSTVMINGQKQPIESDPTAVLAYQLNDSPIYAMEIAGFFKASVFTSGLLPKDRAQDGIFLMQPYKAGKIPVVLVHGTASSPARWAELINELNGDPKIRERFQIWLFIYDSGRPVGYSAGRLRKALTNTVHELDPEGKDTALQNMIVMGHSQGGLLTKLTAVDSGTRFWDLISDKPFEQMQLGPEAREFIQQSAFFTPLPFVRRVVFISTPQHGAMLAASQWVTGLAAKFVNLPITVVNTTALMAQKAIASGDEKVAAKLSRPMTSIDTMNPNNPALQTLASIPVTAVPAHSIIAVEGDGPKEEGNDGVVAYKSAHIDEAVSEFVVRWNHSCQGQPEVIEEIKRILFEHQAASETTKP